MCGMTKMATDGFKLRSRAHQHNNWWEWTQGVPTPPIITCSPFVCSLCGSCTCGQTMHDGHNIHKFNHIEFLGVAQATPAGYSIIYLLEYNLIQQTTIEFGINEFFFFLNKILKELPLKLNRLLDPWSVA